MVGEFCMCSEGVTVRFTGAHTSKNAGMSSEISMRKRDTEYLRFPWLC